MLSPILSILRSFFEILWRRRRLLVIPMLLSIPLSIVGAFLAPTVYVSRALLLLQETASDNLAPREAMGYGDTTRDRIAGLQAFLKSEHILVPVVEAQLGDRASNNPRRIATEVETLRNRLSLELIGNDFLQFQLRGGKVEGLRPILEAVISRFLASLMAPEETVLSATQLVKDRGAKDLEIAERRVADAQQQLSRFAPEARDTLAADQLKQKLAAKSVDLQSARDALNRAKAEAKDDLPEGTDLDRQIEALKAPPGGGGEPAGAPGSGTPAIAKNALDRLMKLRETIERHDRVQREVADISRSLGNLQQASIERTEANDMLTRLMRQRDEARRLNDIYNLRFSAPPQIKPLTILKGPERIRIIDPPKDPVFPVITRRQIAMAGTLGGILLALALVLAAELLDPRIWRLPEFERLTGVLLIAHLPATEPPARLTAPAAKEEHASGDIRKFVAS